MLQTQLCDLLEVTHPIVQAPIGPAAGPELAAAVADAGGVGMLSVTWESPSAAGDLAREARELTGGVVGANIVLEETTAAADPADHIEECLTAGIDVISFAWGEAAPFVDRIHRADCIVCQTIGTAEEAREAVGAGVDFLVTQGWEAGGHVQSDVATLPLVPQVVDVVDVPVVAAGGIADGRGVAAVLALGAAGAWLGTRFVATEEARTHPDYRRAVTEASAHDTIATRLFDLGWPDATHRVLQNSTLAAWEEAGRPAPGSRPGEGESVAELPDGTALPRYSTAMPMAEMTGDLEAMARYAGQSAGLTDDVRAAGEVVEELVDEATAAVDTTTDRLG